MKSIVFFVVLLLFVNFSSQIPQLIDCGPDDVGAQSMTECSRITCKDNGISGVGCGTYQCQPGKQIGYKQQDDTKVYPACCGGPICGD